jgi:hypothetical protein
MRLDVWDAATGQVIHRHPLALPGAVQVKDWLPDGSAVLISVAEEKGGAARFVDPATGRVGPRISHDNRVVLSADGRLAAGGEDAREKNGTSIVRVWEAASGREVACLPTAAPVRYTLGLAPTARALVVADGHLLRLFDLATGRERGRRTLPVLGTDSDQPVGDLEVLPGDRHVLTVMGDGTALVWDLSAFPPPRLADKHGEPELVAWWAELIGDDARKADAAGWKLAEAPADAVVPFLRARLQPAQAPAAEEVRRLIADLDRPTFAARAAAAKKLEDLGPVVLPAIRRALRESKSAEARDRLEKLSAVLTDPTPRPETLRTLRAVAVLERIGTAEGQRVLQILAGGTDGLPETKAARSALARLAPGGW